MDSGFGYEGFTEHPEVPGTGMKVLQNFQNFRVLWHAGVQNFSKFRAGINMLYQYPGSLWHRRTELPEVPGTGMSVLQKLQIEVICRVIVKTRPRKACNYPNLRSFGWVSYDKVGVLYSGKLGEVDRRHVPPISEAIPDSGGNE